MATKIVTKNSSTSGSAPLASDLVQGELAVNVTDKRLYTENASNTIVEVGTNPSTLTVTGEITANGGIALGDNDKATFGAGDDLQIFHDGSSNSSYIKETGTGSFNIEATNLFLKREGGTESFIDCVTNGAVTAYYDGSAKLATTSTGIDVTGTVTADGLTASNTTQNDAIGIAQVVNTTADDVSSSTMTVKNHSGTGQFMQWRTFGMRIGSRIITNNGVGDVAFTVGNDSEAMRLTSTGLGIGTSSPATSLHVNSGANGEILRIQGADAQLRIDNSTANVMNINSSGSGDSLTLSTNDTERMRIDSSGNLLVGTTDVLPNNLLSSKLHVLQSSQGHCASFKTDSNSGFAAAAFSRNGSNGSACEFLYNPTTTVGSIGVTSSATSYNTSSDQRLKENIADADDAGSKIDAIQVRQYDWKADGSHQDYGMIAQELQAVVPEAVSGDADSEEMMGVDYSKLVPMLIKEIQSLRNRVAQLEE
jgi:hypothetical protein